MTKKNILFIVSGPAAPGSTKQDNPFSFLSAHFTGHVLGQTWVKEDPSLAAEYIKTVQPSFGSFQYKAFMEPKQKGIFKHAALFFSYIRYGRQIIKKNKIDAIISYGFLVPGLVGAILSKIYGIPFLVEVPGVPEKAIKFSNSSNKMMASFLLNLSIKLTLKQANGIWMLFKDQLSSNLISNQHRIFVSHEFAPLAMYKPKPISENVISFLGFPWKLKGVDILIEAFKKISPKFPDAKLRIAGYCPDRTSFEVLRQGFETKIEFINSMDRNGAIEFIENTRIFVLPSRTEAMGRVILEALAAEKIVIGSNVDGIPHYIENEFSGLLFESENIESLARCLERILENPEYGEKLAHNGKIKVLERYNEQRYAENLRKNDRKHPQLIILVYFSRPL